MRSLNLVVLVLIFAVLSGCNLFSKQEEEKNEQDNKTAYIKINGITYYDTDFFDFAGVAIREMSEEDYKNADIKKYLVDGFIEHKLLLQEAQKRNIAVDEKRINAVTDSFLTESGTQDLKVYSGSYNTDANSLSNMLREKFMIETLIYDTINANIDISEDEIRKAYNDNYSNMPVSRKAHLFQIFTTDKQQAEKAMAELNRGLSFNEVASRYSEGPEKEDGGDLGMVEDTVYPEIFSEAFKLRVGEYSDIIKSEYGYHIFLVKEYGQAKQASYDELKTDIHFSLYNKEQNKKIEELIDELYKNALIEYLTDIKLSDYTIKSRSDR